MAAVRKDYYSCSPYACRRMHHARHCMLRVGAGMCVGWCSLPPIIMRLAYTKCMYEASQPFWADSRWVYSTSASQCGQCFRIERSVAARACL